MSYTALTDGPDTTVGSIKWAVKTFLDGTWTPAYQATYGPTMNDWNTSSVTDMRLLFFNRTTFNEDISNWDTSSVTTMYAMFRSAALFDQDIGGWNVGNVTDMRFMFYECLCLQPDL